MSAAGLFRELFGGQMCGLTQDLWSVAGHVMQGAGAELPLKTLEQ